MKVHFILHISQVEKNNNLPVSMFTHCTAKVRVRVHAVCIHICKTSRSAVSLRRLRGRRKILMLAQIPPLF